MPDPEQRRLLCRLGMSVASANSLECAVEHPDLDILDSGFVIGRGHADSGHWSSLTIPSGELALITGGVASTCTVKLQLSVGHIARLIGDIDSHGVGVISQGICRV